MADCLIVGMNSLAFPVYLDSVRAMGTQGGAFRDLNLSYIDLDGRPYQALELLTRFYVENGGERSYPFHNADFIWPTITYLGTFLHRRGFTFDWINTFQYEKESFRDKLRQDEPLLVVITTTLYVVPWPIQEIIQFVRQHSDKAKIVVGGPYISNAVKGAPRADVEAHFDALGADYYVISSEGEQSLVGLVSALKSGTEPSHVKNLAYRQGAGWTFTEAVTEKNSLDENLVEYGLFAGRLGQFVSTRTAKSCPFACSFCNFPEQAGAYTFTPVDTVKRELDAIRDVGGVTTVTFIDDTFNVPKRRFKELLAMMIRERYPFKWNCNFRSDHADDEIVAMMAEAGCEGVFLGIESGSAKMLKQMNKTAKPEDYYWAIPRLKQEGILAHANTFIGFPGETMETVEETVRLISETKPATYSVQPWYANPMTPIFRKRQELQIVGSSFKWAHGTMDAATACDLVDHVFRTVDASIFLPQYGFFQWSLFYLRALGMPLERIKSYLRNFNALVRDKMAGGHDDEGRAKLLEAMRAAATFDAAPIDPGPAADLHAGHRRIAAHEHCLREFLTHGDAPPVQTLRDNLTPEEAAWTRSSFEVEAAVDEDVALAAWSVLLWRLNGLEAVPVLLRSGDPLRPLVPFVAHPSGSQSFLELTEGVRSAQKIAREHAFHAMELLRAPPRFSPLHKARPQFLAAFSFESPLDGWLEALPSDLPVRLVVGWTRTANGVSVEVASRASAEVAARIASHLERLVARTTTRMALSLEALDRVSGPPATPAASAALREDVFQF